MGRNNRSFCTGAGRFTWTVLWVALMVMDINMDNGKGGGVFMKSYEIKNWAIYYGGENNRSGKNAAGQRNWATWGGGPAMRFACSTYPHVNQGSHGLSGKIHMTIMQIPSYLHP